MDEDLKLAERLTALADANYTGDLFGRALDDAIAAITRLVKERDEANALVLKVYNLAALIQFEPDAGTPHLVQDGTWDQIMTRAYVHLQSVSAASRAIGGGE